MIWLLLAGCPWVGPDELSTRLDPDDDGYEVGVDCDDDDPDLPTAFYADADHDGYGAAGTDPVMDCVAPGTDWVATDDPTDCDDTDATVHPGATEVCDGIVNACGGDLPADESDDDGPGDGYVECTITTWKGSGLVIGGDDCDDGNGAVYAGATEVCGDGVTNDCDGYDGSCDVLGPDDAATSIAYAPTPLPVAVQFYADGGTTEALAIGLASVASAHLYRSPVPAGELDPGDADTFLVGGTGAGSGFAATTGNFLAVRSTPTDGEAHVLGSTTIPTNAPSPASLNDFATWSGGNLRLTGTSARPISCTALGDFDSDANGDVVAGATLLYGPASGTVSLADVGSPQQSAPRLGLTITGTGVAGPSLLADFVATDGRADLVTVFQDAALVVILPPPPTGNPALAGEVAATSIGNPGQGAQFPGVRISGATADEFGTNVYAVGDFDGDDDVDFAITSPAANSGSGEVLLVLGPIAPGEFDRDDFGNLAGGNWQGQRAVAFMGGPADHLGGTSSPDLTVGDVNGDGLDDLLIAAPDSRGTSGTVYVVYGTETPEDLCDQPDGPCRVGTNRVASDEADEIAGIVIEGNPAERLGADVSVGDYDDDGILDLAILADGQGTGGPPPPPVVRVYALGHAGR